MHIKQVDILGSDIYQFRKEVICNDENFDISYLDNDHMYDANIPEEVWKFSFTKWNSLNFDSLHGVYINNALVAISGSKLYGQNKNFLRVGMMYYVLKKYRSNVRSPLWIKSGLLDQSVLNYKNIDYSFISIYPHNNKLKAWINAFSRQRRLGQLGSQEHLANLKSFKKFDNEILFNNVNQSIFYRSETISSEFSVLDMIKEIADT